MLIMEFKHGSFHREQNTFSVCANKSIIPKPCKDIAHKKRKIVLELIIRKYSLVRLEH
jgi:hypothetical protein